MMKKLIIGNWKSNKNAAEAHSWIEAFKPKISALPENAEVVIAPPFPLLPVLANELNDTAIKLAVQDLSQLSAGSYTGAVSSRNIMGLGVKYAILGHSERRRYFHETHQDVSGKVDQAISAGIRPLVCVDEGYIEQQAAAIDEENLKECIVAYEPLEAIGTGNNVDVGRVKAVAEKIANAFGQVPVLYGGSVDPQNVAEYTLVCEGVLVGGASLDAAEFARLIEKSV